MDLGKEYLKVIQERFQSIKNLGDRTINQLSETDIHWRLNDASNSIAIIVKHVSGNMVSRWSEFLTTDGEKPTRHRDQEFEDDILSKQEMIVVWEKGWTLLFDTLKSLESQDLLTSITIRGEKHTVLEAIERQLAHYAYHTVQLVYIAKQRTNENWETLTIPKGKSEAYLQAELNKHQS